MKYTHLVLILLVAASLAACDEDDASKKKKKTDQVEQTRKSVVGDKPYNIMDYAKPPKSENSDSKENAK